MKVSLSGKKLFMFWALVSGIFFYAPHVHAAIIKPANNLGLVGYWNLNESKGTTAHSHGASSAADGTLTSSPVWSTGKFGGALSFGAANNYVSTSLPWPSSGSISEWVYPTSYDDWISPSGWKTNPGISGNGYMLIDEGGSGSPGTWRFVVRPSVSGASEAGVTALSGITQNTWQYLTATWSLSGAVYTIKFYVNGVLQGSNTWSGTPGSLGSFNFGKSGDYPDNYFKGKMDEVRVYNRALSASEVMAFYNQTAGAKVSADASGNNGLSGSLTSSWSFDSSTISGATVSDLSGNNHNLTLVNGASIGAGRSGQALTLDGTNQYAYGLIGTLPTSVSLSMWVKANDVSTTQSVLVEEGDGAPSSGYHFTLVGIFNGAFYGGFWDIGDIASSPITAGQWYHVVLSYDGVAHTQSLYLDDVLQGTQSGTWSPPSNIYFLTGYQQQGCSFTDPSGHCGDLAHYFNGQIDDLQAFNQALTQQDVDNLSDRTAVLNAGGAALQSGTTLSNGLTGYWSFDGKDFADKVYDRSGQGNNGYLYNAATSSAKAMGKLGQGAQFNSAGYIVVPDSTSLDSSDLTLAGWFKFNSLNSAYQTMFGKWYVGVKQQYLIQINNNNKIGFWTGNGSTGGDVLESTSAPAAGKWYFIVATISGTSKKLYINGVLDNSGTGSAIGSSNVELTIGSKKNSGGSYFEFANGAMDELRTYNRALSASEVQQLYQLGR